MVLKKRENFLERRLNADVEIQENYLKINKKETNFLWDAHMLLGNKNLKKYCYVICW